MKNEKLYTAILLFVIIIIVVLVINHISTDTIEAFGRKCGKSKTFCFEGSTNDHHCGIITKNCRKWNKKNKPKRITNQQKLRKSRTKCKEKATLRCAQARRSSLIRVPGYNPRHKYVFDYGLIQREFNLHYLDGNNTGRKLREFIKESLLDLEHNLNTPKPAAFPEYIRPLMPDGFDSEHRNFEGEVIVKNGDRFEKFSPWHVNFFLSKALIQYKDRDRNAISNKRTESIGGSDDVNVDQLLVFFAGHTSYGLFRLIHNENYRKWRIDNFLGEDPYEDPHQFPFHLRNFRRLNDQYLNCVNIQSGVMKVAACPNWNNPNEKSLYDDANYMSREFSNLGRSGPFYMLGKDFVRPGLAYLGGGHITDPATFDRDFKRFVVEV